MNASQHDANGKVSPDYLDAWRDCSSALIAAAKAEPATILPQIAALVVKQTERFDPQTMGLNADLECDVEKANAFFGVGWSDVLDLVRSEPLGNLEQNGPYQALLRTALQTVPS